MLPCPQTKPVNQVMQIWVKLTGCQQKVLAVCDGGADVAIMSLKLYSQLDPKPELRATDETVRGLYGPDRNPLGECTVQVLIPELAVQVGYNFIVDLLLDAGLMSYAGVQCDYDKQQLSRKDKRTKSVSRVCRSAFKVRRVELQKDWVIQPQSRQLVPGKLAEGTLTVPQQWLIEPTKKLTERHSVLVGRSLCQESQMKGVIPVEINNPLDEPVHLFKRTTLALASPIQELTDVRLNPNESSSKRVAHVSSKAQQQEKLPEELALLVTEAGQILTTPEKEKFAALITEYRDIFSTQEQPLGQCNVVEHDIKTEGPPIKMRFRRIPAGLRDEAVAEEERMKKMGVIEPSESPWAAPVVLVRKRDGSLRYCIDYRRLNTVTQKDSYPLPNMQDCLDSLEGASFFSTMDLSSGYWQVKLTEDAKDKTSFYGAGGGLWRFTVMPFGLCNAPATFERLMERVLGQLQWQIFLCYLDDILIFSRSVDRHLEDLRTVFQRLRKANLKLKPKKCHFFQREVAFLGHVVSAEGVRTDPGKIQRIKECSVPTDIHGVRSAMGLFSYYQRFIPGFSEIARPLIQLTEKDRPFTWGEVEESAFQTLKERLGSAPVLAHPRAEGQFILDTDASDEGIGAVLSQVQDGEERVICFGSKRLSKTERNYCITRRELLAVVTFVLQYKHFLAGRKFLVRTDNSAVRYWTKIHADNYDPEGQAARWMVKLAAYDFDIKHRPGKQHTNADGMSRPPFLWCAQCDTRHRGAHKTKRRKAVEETVLDTHKTRRLRRRKSKTSQPVKGEKDVDQGDRLPQSSQEETGVRSSRAERARVLTRSQAPSSRSDDVPWMGQDVIFGKDALREEQLKDPAAVDAICWLKSGEKPDKQEVLRTGLDAKFLWANFACLETQSGLLCKRVGPLMDGSTHVTVYVPPSLRRKAMESCHDARTAGHFYFWKTLNRVKRRFCWPGMRRDIQIYCRACSVCATKKTAGRRPKAEMRRYDVGLPMEEVAIDLMGPFTESSSGNKHVLVVVDSFSKWMEAYPVPNIEAKTVAEKLVLEFFSRFGVPRQIKSDRGRQFECELFREMCSLLEVEHKMSTPFHPQGNSRVERMVKVVGNLISVFCRDYDEWDRNLPLLTLAYRSTVHEVTGFTPNYVMTGREVNLPLDVMLGMHEEGERKTLPEYVQKLKSRLSTCFEEVREHLQQFGERQQRYYNLSAHSHQYQPGDAVYLREKTRKKQVSPKLQAKWKGPFVVVKQFGTVIEVMTGTKVSKLYHHDLLKPCFATEVPPWVGRAQRKLRARAAATQEVAGNGGA